jgi:septation ring formation regulator EzrA|tara:strand:- start:74 stop:280 length:207 start_codon:yes stop_codon:yes gene_type:complete
MDTSRWKSILVPRDMYDEVRAIATLENRAISGQLRTIFESWKNDNLTEDDRSYIKVAADELRESETAA